MTVLPELRESLVRAAAREMPESPAPQGRRFVRGLRAVPAAAALLLTLAVAVIALGDLHHAPSRRPAVNASASSRRQLIDILAPLRRTQTRRDLSLALLKRPAFLSGPSAGALGLVRGAIDLPLVRYAATAPWGERFFLVPMKPPGAAAIAEVEAQVKAGHLSPAFLTMVRRRAARGETLGVFSDQGGGGGATAAAIEAGDDGLVDGAGREWAFGSTDERVIFVVPDGVARVEFRLPPQARQDADGSLTYVTPAPVTVRVDDNLVAAQLNGDCCGTPPEIWFGAGGRVLRRVGDFAALHPREPQPAPETALSRAAQRNPATPNPVSVTPAVGGQTSDFRIHFRVLLNGADYTYVFSGARCARFPFSSGTGDPSILRGAEWNDYIGGGPIVALCPGTYRVSVAVEDLGPFGVLARPAAPFGSASFTVRG